MRFIFANIDDSFLLCSSFSDQFIAEVIGLHDSVLHQVLLLRFGHGRFRPLASQWRILVDSVEDANWLLGTFFK